MNNSIIVPCHKFSQQVCIKMNNRREHNIVIRATDFEKMGLAALAHRYHTTLSGVVRMLVEQELNKHKTGINRRSSLW